LMSEQMEGEGIRVQEDHLLLLSLLSP